MDFSNYKNTPNKKYRKFYSKKKYLQPGFFKDETGGVYIKEFCGKEYLFGKKVFMFILFRYQK